MIITDGKVEREWDFVFIAGETVMKVEVCVVFCTHFSEFEFGVIGIQNILMFTIN